ncbi:xin actin-binding repeat-containing protein 1-like [Myxocyprinus asiaticus]|uniref:xin actin-binding repeat-containing protein 1-like n=1 Tax=Myxocyprinus asiaticus TaxID=70543 RepID=UPI00222370A7|nr:xin actin-binding repeat-containing protein 1-like [Myxocyprinus asiaticus]
MVRIKEGRLQTSETARLSTYRRNPLFPSKLCRHYICQKWQLQSLQETLLKPEQDPTSPTGKRPNPSKMAEEAQNISKHAIANVKGDAPESNPSTHQLETCTDEHKRPFTSPPPSREAMSNLHQRRQKCELKRLLKHTCPELKTVDSMVEEELADILNPDPAEDTGYQGEVQSRCWQFENHAIDTVDFHGQKEQQMKRDFQDNNVKRTSGLFKQLLSGSHNEEGKPQPFFQSRIEPIESEEVISEEVIKVDVKATRRMFETQPMDTQRDSLESPCPIRNVAIEEKCVSNQKPTNDTCDYNDSNRTKPSDIQQNSDMNLSETNEVFVGISRAKQVFENRSHNKKDLSSTNDCFSKEEEMLKANVRSRAQMFESTPLDKINQQTKEESDTMLENMEETLISLYNFNIIHSEGTLLEANETGHVKKATYNFIQDIKPEIHDEEIATGSIKSIMLQMLPGTNLDPVVTFLKEDNQGNVEIHKVDVPTHQLPFTVHQDKDCRTANVVQITEDLLNQEDHLRKGVLIQEGATGIREMAVYALFSHSEVVKFGQMECESISSCEKKIPEPEKADLKTDFSCTSGAMQENALAINVDTNRTRNVQLFQSCIEKGEPEHLKYLQKASSEEDLSVSHVEGDKTIENMPGNVKSIKALFITTNLDATNLNLQPPENKSKVSLKQTVRTFENKKIEEPNQTKAEKCGYNMQPEIILQDQDMKYICKGNMNDGAVLQAELVDAVEDDKLLNLQTAIMNLHQATMEAKALQQSVQAKHQPASQTNQIQQIIDPGSVSQETMNKDSNVSVNEESSQITKNEEEKENKGEVMRGSIQAALDSLGKSNFNVTKGDFRAVMIYRNAGKGYAGLKKETDVKSLKQPSGRTIDLEENKSSASSPEPHAEQEALKAPREGDETGPCQRSPENKPVICSPMINQVHGSTDTPLKNRKNPIGPKPAIPPKPDHLKPNANAGVALGYETNADHLNNGQVIATCSKLPNEDIKEPSSPKPCPNSMSYKDVLCKNVQNSGEANEFDASTQSKLNFMNAVEETPKSSVESLQSMNESSTFHTTIQNFRVKVGGSVPPVKPKRIKMAKDQAKNIAENTNNNTAVLQAEINNSFSCDTYKIDYNNCQGSNDKCDDQQKSGVVLREKKMRRETEDERRQRLSVHMDEIMKGNVVAVMEIFDKLKMQEELKSILSKVEEIEEDTNEVDVSSLRNIFESVPDWVVPREKKAEPKIVQMEQRRERPSEPEMLSSMEVAFEDLEKAGVEIIHLKEQTLARLMDIEEAIKKALYSVSTLKSDSDIVGLSGLFRESMVTVQGSPPSGNIRKISIGSSKSPKAQNQNGLGTLRRGVPGQSTKQEQNSNPEHFIPTTKQKSISPVSPSFISIQSAARKSSETPVHSTSQKADPKEEAKPQCCCNVATDRRQCSVTKEPSFSPANQRRQVSVLEVQTVPEGEKVIGTKTISENYERTDCFGNKFYSSKTSTVVTTQPETRTTSKKFIMSSQPRQKWSHTQESTHL